MNDLTKLPATPHLSVRPLLSIEPAPRVPVAVARTIATDAMEMLDGAPVDMMMEELRALRADIASLRALPPLPRPAGWARISVPWHEEAELMEQGWEPFATLGAPYLLTFLKRPLSADEVAERIAGRAREAARAAERQARWCCWF